jgi:hypothetical protein
MVLLTSFLLAGFIAAHPLHVSITSVEINTEQKAVVISHKFYTGDFSLLFYHLFEKNIEPQKDKEFNTAEIELINSYMHKRFMLVSGSDTISLGYLRKEQNEESIWLYYSGKLSKRDMKTLIINNLLMLDLYEDQTNLVIVTRGIKENGLTFNATNRQSVVDIRDE